MADTPPGTTTDHHQPADASASLRVLVVDDHALVRSGVRSELTAHAPDLDVIAEADDVEGAIAAVHALRPDVVLLDVHLPGGNGGGGAEGVASCHGAPAARGPSAPPWSATAAVPEYAAWPRARRWPCRFPPDPAARLSLVPSHPVLCGPLRPFPHLFAASQSHHIIDVTSRKTHG